MIRRLATPFATPMGGNRRGRARRTPGGTPLPAPLDLSIHAGESRPAQRASLHSFSPPAPKAFRGLLWLGSVKRFDELIDRVIAEVSRG